MTNKKIWAATLFSTLLLTMTISSPVKAAELQTSTTVDRSQITLPLSEETEENLFSLESVSDIQMSELVDPDEVISVSDGDDTIRTGSIATAVGNPVMCAASTKIIPGTSVTATGSGYSSTRTFSVSGDDIPNTAQVRTISLSGTGMSKIKRWRLMAPNKSVWVANESDFYPSINFNFVNDSSSNAKLKGTWSVAFQSSSSSYTFIPSYSVSYYYEYGD